ncbi:MAG TPA: hypothetical protein VFR70_10560, partial [Flavobacterium sp.]|nr:hypothetical protein [Flavobacterium sp.]
MLRWKKIRSLALLFGIFLMTECRGQEQDSLSIEAGSLDDVDTVQLILPENRIHNSRALKSFYEKLNRNRQSRSGKINIVHIGDSHIQADLMTNSIRKKLQQEFGNGGRGFIFPYSLARTNGSYNE